MRFTAAMLSAAPGWPREGPPERPQSVGGDQLAQQGHQGRRIAAGGGVRGDREGQALRLGLVAAPGGEAPQADLGRRRERDRRELGPPGPPRGPAPSPVNRGTDTARSSTPSRRHSTRRSATSSSAAAGAGRGPKRSSHSARTSATSATVRTADSRRYASSRTSSASTYPGGRWAASGRSTDSSTGRGRGSPLSSDTASETICT